MTVTEGILIFATIAGPVLAVQAQKWIERIRERRSAQRRIFHALMATRATRVAPEHVQALNMIDLEFGGAGSFVRKASEKDVVDNWRIYADHLNQSVDDKKESNVSAWVEKGDDLFIELLHSLAIALGYNFEKVQLRRGIYFPRAHNYAERRRELFELATLDVLTGKSALSMKVTEFPEAFKPSPNGPSGPRSSKVSSQPRSEGLWRPPTDRWQNR